MGGKKRIAKNLHDIMVAVEEELYGNKKLPYFEPFCGMCSVAKEFDDGRARTVCDLNPDVVKLWKAVLYNSWRPPKLAIDVTYYNRLKASKTPSAERAFYGTACAFGGIYFSGFSGNAGANTRREIETGYQKLCEYKSRLKNAKVMAPSSYLKHKPKHSLVYCDPPYVRTIGKSGSNNYLNQFNSDEFWDTMRKWSKNNLVFVSEERAPKDFVCIWTERVLRSVNGKRNMNDKLFIHESYI